ncbi:hypothetical protein DBB36_21345 [Flavobacterium sp. WLB]|nr:hypothetical protein AKO67_12000 [Flavobacterium sp. VMW]OWU90689.1 hypothetical protein APR43_11970 [Flavobacterium sp. NLM]PUU67949.1 hypothetical protein DBB36_21345 [Flavobacterium sp. WLB]
MPPVLTGDIYILQEKGFSQKTSLAKAFNGDFIFPPVKTGGYLINYKNFAPSRLCEIKSVYNTLTKILAGLRLRSA